MEALTLYDIIRKIFNAEEAYIIIVKKEWSEHHIRHLATLIEKGCYENEYNLISDMIK